MGNLHAFNSKKNNIYHAKFCPSSAKAPICEMSLQLKRV